MTGLRDILRRLAPRAGFSGAPAPAPGEPLLVLGDIHGRADLLERVLRRRDALWPEARLVTLGDYIDRGPDSAAVLRLLQAETGPLPPPGGADAQAMAERAEAPGATGGRAGAPAAGTGTICLAGNHEAMMLAFLDDPEANGPGWLRNGGVETLASFGIDVQDLPEDAGAPGRKDETPAGAARIGKKGIGRPDTDGTGRSETGSGDACTRDAGSGEQNRMQAPQGKGEKAPSGREAGRERARGPSLPDGACTALCARLRAAMGPATEAWLRALPLWWQSGDLAMVHAGADPALPFEAQLRRSLLWGHPDFVRRPRMDGIWVAYGHKIHPAAVVAEGRIALDTGAYATGRLSHALIAPGLIELHST